MAAVVADGETQTNGAAVAGSPALQQVELVDQQQQEQEPPPQEDDPLKPAEGKESISPTPWEPYESVCKHSKKWAARRAPFLYPLQRRINIGRFHLTYAEAFIWLPLALLLTAIPAVAACESGGGISSIFLPLSFLFAIHNSPLTYLLGVPFERAIRYHKAASFAAFVSGGLHGFVQCENNFSGTVLVIAMGVLVASSFFRVFREKFFEVWYYLHLVALAVTIVFAIIHGAGVIALGLALWSVDLGLRYWYMAGRYAHEAKLVALPADVIRITFSKKEGNFKYKGGQYVFLMIPELSMFEWHPFSISSSPHDAEVTLHVRVLGGWTKRLHALAAKNGLKGAPIVVKIYLEGPYGELGVDLDGPKYKSVLLISGGIGITPLQSVCNELLDQCERGRTLDRLWFVWSCADHFLLNSMYDKDAEAERSLLPMHKAIPKSFQPVLLRRLASPNTRADEEKGRGGEGAKDGEGGGKKDGDFFRTDFHLTRMKRESRSDLTAANVHLDLQEHVRAGRPDLAKIFAEASAECSSGLVAVLVCGPPSLIKDVRLMCDKHSTNKVSFDFHEETFLL